MKRRVLPLPMAAWTATSPCLGTAGGSRQCDGFHSSSRSMPPDNVVLGGHRRVRILSADAGHAAREASAALSGTQRPSPNKVACVGLQSGSISTPSKRRFQVATTITIYDLMLSLAKRSAHTPLAARCLLTPSMSAQRRSQRASARLSLEPPRARFGDNHGTTGDLRAEGRGSRGGHAAQCGMSKHHAADPGPGSLFLPRD